ncbi:MAG: beta-N-acetylhexosaminidase, partial [Immundisolibacteraceae bacterium]|nr:beta-N-acetylhexosaminidase [Immundisolibacteraceae bacterium]
RQAAFEHGRTVGQECAEIGFDLVYAPVLDLDWGISEVIGDRAFDADPQVVGVLGAQMMAGLHAGGVSAVAKHFPGHGGVVADSHHEHAVDQRSLIELAADMAPYRTLIEAGLDGVMMAHVSYPEIDADEAGYSAFWIEQLRALGFNGVIHSDDLSMAGASAVGDLHQRVIRARQAGCERLLVCNRSPEELSRLLDQL